MKHRPGKKGCSYPVCSLGSHYQLGSQDPSDNQKLADALNARLQLPSRERDSKNDATPYHHG